MGDFNGAGLVFIQLVVGAAIVGALLFFVGGTLFRAMAHWATKKPAWRNSSPREQAQMAEEMVRDLREAKARKSGTPPNSD